jgi:hypothetical protein
MPGRLLIALATVAAALAIVPDALANGPVTSPAPTPVPVYRLRIGYGEGALTDRRSLSASVA